MFANALVLPVFDYLDIIYNRACKSRLLELDILYKKVAKIALDVPKQESSLTVYKDMKWLPLHLRRQLHTSNYVFRIIKECCPHDMKDKFKYTSGGSRIAENCNLYVPKSKTHKEFYYLGAISWNSLSSDLRNLDDVKEFSNKLKALYLSSILSDVNYRPDNSVDYIYKPVAP